MWEGSQHYGKMTTEEANITPTLSVINWGRYTERQLQHSTHQTGSKVGLLWQQLESACELLHLGAGEALPCSHLARRIVCVTFNHYMITAVLHIAMWQVLLLFSIHTSTKHGLCGFRFTHTSPSEWYDNRFTSDTSIQLLYTSCPCIHTCS